MIYDVLSNAEDYADVNPGVYKLLEYVKNYASEEFPDGHIVIENDNIFFRVAKYETHSTENALVEAHKQFIDVMIMLDGCETIYVKDVNRLHNITKPYDPEIEALLADFDSDATAVRMEKGNFLVLLPQDAHSPACHADGPCKVKKIIGKVRIC